MTTAADGVVVRDAVPADAPEIARVHIAAWRETYSRLLPDGALDVVDAARYTARWLDAIERLPAASRLAVAERDGSLVGWARSGPPEHPEPRDVELEGLYVLRSAHGSSAGCALLDAVLGERPAVLWVAEDNPRAQAFYRREGFSPDGASRLHELVGHPVRIVRWVR